MAIKPTGPEPPPPQAKRNGEEKYQPISSAHFVPANMMWQKRLAERYAEQGIKPNFKGFLKKFSRKKDV